MPKDIIRRRCSYNPRIEVLEIRETPAAFTPGNLVVYRITDGTLSNASEIVLEEYTPAGILVQSLPLPSSGSNAITVDGTATSTGLLTLSTDNQFLVVPGYRKNVNSSDPSADSAVLTPRVVATVDLNGLIDTSTALNDAFSGGDLRGVASDGTTLWLSGNTGLNVATPGATTSTSIAQNPNTDNLRGVGIFDGQLYIASASMTPGPKVFAVGTGLPTSGTQSYVSLFPPTQISGYTSFVFFDLSTMEPGVDTLYAATLGTLEKFTKGNGVWFLTESTPFTGILAVTGRIIAEDVVALYATTSTTLQTLIDTSGYNGVTPGLFSPVATAAGNNRFGGLAFAPSVPPINNPPVNIVPGTPLETDEDTALAITGLAVADPDTAGATVTVTLQVSHGGLVLDTSVNGGLTTVQVQVLSSRSVAVTAPIAAINATLATPNGLVYTPDPNYSGTDILAFYTNDLGNTGTPGPKFDQELVPITVVRKGGLVAVGADAGSQPFVKVFDPETNDLLYQFLAYDPTFSGGVRLALADINNDNVPDIITIPGPGIVTEVRVFDGTNGSQLNVTLNGLKPLGATFTQGGFLAAGDANLDSNVDIVLGPNKGGGGQVRFINGTLGLESFKFRPFPKAYKGGIQVAMGDVDTISVGLEIVVVPTGPLPLGKPSRVRVYASNGLPLSGPGRNFVPLATNKKGFNLTLAEINGTGGIDIILGTMAGALKVLLIDSTTGQTALTLTNSTLGMPATYLGPVRVAFGLEDDGSMIGVYTAPGNGGPPDLKFFSGVTPTLMDTFQPQDGFNGFWIASSH